MAEKIQSRHNVFKRDGLSADVEDGGGSAHADAQDLARAVRPPVLRISVPKDGESPDFILDGFAQVVELYQADPVHADRTWKGKATTG